ncbi:cache domain-containing sensor histidine kinase [Paenibacillus sedimenti]|uniref:histidine kinase n=1 Tax=Paenibacillus sedimenti TaxID=2770274 RepID=A0A926KPS0_9BACL|nr:sensor histidine kinase [Paenibacillus sedimenti]MBD0380911.1 sensor histidine kinase [Paenibacillus sedimenti]
MRGLHKLYKKAVSDLSIFNKIFYGVLAIVILIIAGSSFFSNLYSRNLYETQATNNAVRLVDNINTGFEDNLDQVDRIIQSIYAESDYADSNNSIKQVLSTKTFASISDEYNALKVVQNFFQRLMFLRKDFNSIYIYNSKDKFFSYALNGTNKLDYDPTGESWYKETVAADGRTIISAPHKPYQLNYNKEVISYSRLLKNMDQINREPYGVILIDLSIDSLNSIVDKVNLGETTGVLFLDGKGKAIYADNMKVEDKDIAVIEQEITQHAATGKFTAILSNKKYLISFSTSMVTGWKLLTFTPYTEITKVANQLVLFDLLLGLVALLFAVGIAYAFSKLMFKPIHKLKKGINNVKVGNFDFELEYASNDELGQLVRSFNTMVFTIKTLILEKYEEKLARKDAEFKYLQAQINPHFIYNTLQIISSMAVVHKVPEINTASKSLARIMRYSLNAKNKLTIIKDEMEVLVCYLDIQKLRFREFLNYEIEMDEEVKEHRILKLILQPVVENAVSHGIEPKGANGIIKISGKLEGQKIRIIIEDNGVGIAKDEIDKLLQIINSADEIEDTPYPGDGHNSIGLRNINQRMKLIYGQEYGIDIESIQGAGTRVIISIPVQKLTAANSTEGEHQ